MEKEKEEVFGEGKYGFSRRRIKTEKEKEENIWRRKISFFAEEREKEENIWRRKTSFCGGEEKRRRKRRKIFEKRRI